MDNVWKSGDIVRLGIDGQVMTVQFKTSGKANVYRCCWFTNEMKLRSAVFNGDQLQRVSFNFNFG